MRQNAASLWNLLSHPQCHYYACGDSKIVDDVSECLMEIAKINGQLSHAESVDFFNKMKQEKRFHTDIWGIQLNYKKAIQQVQKDNYSKAEKWLEQVQQSSADSPNIEPVSSVNQ